MFAKFYKPVNFYHFGVNVSIGFVSGGDDDLFYFDDVGKLGHGWIPLPYSIYIIIINVLNIIFES